MKRKCTRSFYQTSGEPDSGGRVENAGSGESIYGPFVFGGGLTIEDYGIGGFPVLYVGMFAKGISREGP